MGPDRKAGAGAHPDSPIYARILAKLQERIDLGHYPIDSHLPTEAQLSEEFAASRHTVREALRRLNDQGFIRRRQGAGTVVVSSTPRTQYVQSFGSLTDLFQNAVQTHYVLHSVSTVALDAEIAERVDGTAGEEWLLVVGVRWTAPGGVPIAHIHSYVPTELAGIVAKFTGAQMPFYAILEKDSGRIIENVYQEIRAVDMPQEVANSFGLQRGSRSLQLLRRYVTQKGVLIASFNWHRGDQFTYKMQIERRVPEKR
jgi:DNA-binding GntR family transcriptional regulator